jgi:hypothetical protein
MVECSTTLTADAVKPGDVSVCYSCGELLEFDGSLQLVKVTPEKALETVLQYPGIVEMQTKIRRRGRLSKVGGEA